MTFVSLDFSIVAYPRVGSVGNRPPFNPIAMKVSSRIQGKVVYTEYTNLTKKDLSHFLCQNDGDEQNAHYSPKLLAKKCSKLFSKMYILF